MKLSEIQLQQTHRVCVFGDSKTGKTELVGKLAEKFKLLWFDLENGYITLAKLPHKLQENIDVIRIPDSKVFPIAIETMLKVITGLPVEICAEHGKVSCPMCKKDNKVFEKICLNELDKDTIVVVDSMTQLANSAMNHLTKNESDTYKPEWSDYRNQGQLMDKFLSQVQQSKFNSICITHVAEVEMEDGKKKLVPIAGTTNFSRNTAKYFDDVVYSQILNQKHRFASATTFANNVITGSRLGIEIEKSPEATLLDIFNFEVKRDNLSLVQSQVKNLIQKKEGV